MTTPRDDLQDFLSGNDPLNELYTQRDKPEPPAALDAAILSAARAHARTPERPRWLVPVSLAATVVLGTGLTIKQFSSPMRTVSESALQEAMADANEIDQIMPPELDAAPIAARARLPSLDAIPTIDAGPNRDTEFDRVPAPANVNLDEARRQARQSVSRSAPAPEMPSVAPSVEREPEFAPAAPAQPEHSGLASTDDQASALAVERQTLKRTIAKLAESADGVTERSAPQRTLRKHASPTPGLQMIESALRVDQVDLAKALFEQMRIQDQVPSAGEERKLHYESFAPPPAATADQAGSGDLASHALDRVRALHAEGDARTAYMLLDLLLESYPQLALPEDLPLQPFESR